MGHDLETTNLIWFEHGASAVYDLENTNILKVLTLGRSEFVGSSVVLSLWSKIIHCLMSHGVETLTRLFFMFPWAFQSLDIWTNKKLYSIIFLPPLERLKILSLKGPLCLQ